MNRCTRISSLVLSTAVFLAVGSLHESVQAMPQISSEAASIAPMIEEVAPGVVGISVLQSAAVSNPLLDLPIFRDLFEQMERKRGGATHADAGNSLKVRPAGSGVVVDANDGIVLTNNHVVKGATRIVVVLKDRREFDAELVGTDPDTDIAVLKIKADRLRSVKIGDSESLKVGDFALAIGNPFSLGQTVTMGIVSAVGRSLSANGFEDYVQTDAAINPGNSGGALVNSRGELIGINTSIYTRGGASAGNIGIGFAVPAQTAVEVMRQILRFGEVRRGQIGAQLDEVTSEIAIEQSLGAISGAVASEVLPNSAADLGGLRVGDVILSANGRPVRTSADVRKRVALTPVGETIELQVSRNRQVSLLRLEVEAIPEAVSTTAGQFSSGQSGAPRAPQTPSQSDGKAVLATMRLAVVPDGVRVAFVVPHGAAQAAGFRKADVILAVERDVVRTPNDVSSFIARPGQKMLTILRDGGKLHLTVG